MFTKWFFTAAVAILAFIIAGLFGAFAADALRLWNEPVIGFCAAFAVVLSTYLSAPHHKLRSSVAAFFIGAVFAWFLLEHSFYPERYGEGLAYTSTRLPTVVTYAGGLIGCLVSALLSRWVGLTIRSSRDRFAARLKW